MIIAIDASRSIDSIQKTGVEKVSDELLMNIKNQISKIKNNDNDLDIFYYTPEYIPWLPKEEQKILSWPFKYLWTQIRLAWELLIHPPDKLFIPVHKIPLISLLITHYSSLYKIIHDVAFLKNPEAYSPFQHWYLKFDLKLTLRKCTKIFVPTQQVKDDLIKHTNVNQHKIIVIPHGYTPTNLLTYQLRKKQILYIGRVEEKKNIGNLIKAFEIFNQKNPGFKLILAGKPGMGFNKQWCHQENIKCLGYVSDEKKHELLKESICLTLISKQEGFGFPILEAWDYELPVLASNLPVLKEIGQDACVYVNPNSPEQIAQGLERIISNQNLRQDLIKKGKARLQDFNWQKAAQRYLQNLTKQKE